MPLRQYRAECSLAGVGGEGRGSGAVPHVNDLLLTMGKTTGWAVSEEWADRWAETEYKGECGFMKLMK